MRKNAIVFATLVSAALLAACGPSGPARPQLKQVDFSDGSRVQLTYDGDRLSTLRALDDEGRVVRDGTATYDGVQLKTFSVGEPGKTASQYSYTYDSSGRLTKVAMANSGSTYTYDVTYSDGRISRTELAIVGGGISATTKVDYSYTETNQLKERKTSTVSVFPIIGTVVAMSTETFSYASDTGLLEEVLVNNGDTNTIYEFTFDAQGRLSEVVGGGETYSADYGTDGNISRTTLESNGSITFTSYAYNSGTVSGVLAKPMVNFGELFDMAGRTLPTDQVYVSSGLMGL